ncbi:hypothetical protein [Rhizobium sp. BK251]|uniref:hypothetical protein n=1 Tax=Rhizobium sp. BK251 TaxID=2512125 RepID=UPI001052CF39|nr:hypothetical protein [Rhizobium sp. BK251]TCL74446.1 hypothetical protein EV286_1026 [Rhizobium sp. BK251]
MADHEAKQIIEAVGRRIGALQAQLDEIRLGIPSVAIERHLNSVRRGLDALGLEITIDGMDCAAYCERHYAQPLGDALSEYYFATGLPFSVPLELPNGSALMAEKQAQRFDRLRFLHLVEVERICGTPILRGRLVKGSVDISRVVALNKHDPAAILESSASHLFLFAKAERLRAFSDGLRDHPLGSPVTARFCSLLSEASAMGADTTAIRLLERRLRHVITTLEAAADQWEAAAIKFGRTAYREAHAAHLQKSDTPLPSPASVHDRYGECAARYVAGQPFRLKYLGGQADA